ncbi:MAG: 2-oxoacid:acceptor oxidoreductase family protein [Clostridia bacterium]|jgi:2-oxoglutarate ferredoxin oxidoreductase subunit gamma|nr:2-oxoacid:acceptor oxidoreductase family protein [Clostridia bacterium]MBT7123432.1 2-oxoacid:acceptor oxidoreductase family protein [Clostridia bacterium]
MINKLISAGFGGQGVLLLGQLVTYAGMIEDKHVSWMPSYGPEMRGGTANCNVIVSSDPVGSPVVTNADAVIALNGPSLDKFEKTVKPGGKLFINSSIVEKKAKRKDIDVYNIPASEMAIKFGNSKVTNMVMLGAYVTATAVVTKDSIMIGIKKFLGKSKAHLIALNEKAFDAGAKLVR